MVGWFVAMDGEQKGEDFRVRDGQNILGSGPEADIVIRDGTVSARHASLRYKDQRFYLTDLDSSNGTYLNNSSRVHRPRRTARQRHGAARRHFPEVQVPVNPHGHSPRN